jgi:hypothetical protein
MACDGLAQREPQDAFRGLSAIDVRGVPLGGAVMAKSGCIPTLFASASDLSGMP